MRKMKKHYSEEEQKALRTNPHVLEVREDRMSLTIEFRQQIYEKWLDSPFVSTIKIMLEDNGFNTRSLGENFVKCINHVFKRGGKPQWSKAVSGTVPNDHAHAGPLNLLLSLLKPGNSCGKTTVSHFTRSLKQSCI